VYYATQTTTLHDEPHEQIAFVWPNPADSGKHGLQGVRMTLDWEGYPIIWEVLHDPSGLRVLYVSRSLEDAAAGHFGPPLPGRRFSVERSVDETPGVVVARVLDDGPAPMGPWVYLLDDAHTVTTLLCRCMPSQANDFAETGEYALRPMAELESGEYGVESRASFSLEGNDVSPPLEDALRHPPQ
jgi:hypothetical protein